MDYVPACHTFKILNPVDRFSVTRDMIVATFETISATYNLIYLTLTYLLT